MPDQIQRRHDFSRYGGDPYCPAIDSLDARDKLVRLGKETLMIFFPMGQ
jgi:hypothetical protein